MSRRVYKLKLNQAKFDEVYKEFQHKVNKSNGEMNGKKIELSDIADNYKFSLHHDIEDVSGELFKDGHYAQSVFEACKKVINKVKELAPEVDASSDYGRMGKIFNPENPVIKFNNLQNQSEVDEQKGFMHLFLGLVMIRNFKGHENVNLNDAGRAFEYLTLTSLLISKLDERIIE